MVLNMKQFIKKLDNGYMSFLNWSTSTKSACYILSLIIIISVIINPPSNLQGWLLVVVSIYYQGVALSALGSQQKDESTETRKLLQETHDEVLVELQELKEIIEILKSK